MTVIQIILSADFLIAISIYSLVILLALPLFDWIHKHLQHPFLQWNWDHIGMPLLQAGLMVLFIIIAYPIIFGIDDAPAITTLLSTGNYA